MDRPRQVAVKGQPLLPVWEQLAVAKPQPAATMSRYLEQIACVFRPGSVSGADLALRSFAGFFVETAPDVAGIADITRRHVEGRCWPSVPGSTCPE